MNIYHPYTLFPLGDKALTIDFGNLIDEYTNKKVLALFQQLRKSNLPFTDLVPAYSSLTVYYDVAAIYAHKEADKTAFETMADLVEGLAASGGEIEEEKPSVIEIPVCYSDLYALDKEELENKTSLSFEQIVELHTASYYRVFMIGFLPGFAYMGEVDPRISIARKAVPTNVKAGSVGIAGRQTGIYPLDSPGGWQIIGRTPRSIFRKDEKNPVLFRAGDEVKFYSISEDEFRNYKNGHS